jgi:hypothetical protein
VGPPRPPPVGRGAGRGPWARRRAGRPPLLCVPCEAVWDGLGLIYQSFHWLQAGRLRLYCLRIVSFSGGM